MILRVCFGFPSLALKVFRDLTLFSSIDSDMTSVKPFFMRQVPIEIPTSLSLNIHTDLGTSGEFSDIALKNQYLHFSFLIWFTFVSYCFHHLYMYWAIFNEKPCKKPLLYYFPASNIVLFSPMTCVVFVLCYHGFHPCMPFPDKSTL